MSHSCTPNCQAIVMACNGRLTIALYTLRQVGRRIVYSLACLGQKSQQRVVREPTPLFSRRCLTAGISPLAEAPHVDINAPLVMAAVLSPTRQVYEGEELTFDYSSVTESEKEFREAICLCSTRNCRYGQPGRRDHEARAAQGSQQNVAAVLQDVQGMHCLCSAASCSQ